MYFLEVGLHLKVYVCLFLIKSQRKHLQRYGVLKVQTSEPGSCIYPTRNFNSSIQVGSPPLIMHIRISWGVLSHYWRKPRSAAILTYLVWVTPRTELEELLR